MKKGGVYIFNSEKNPKMRVLCPITVNKDLEKLKSLLEKDSKDVRTNEVADLLLQIAQTTRGNTYDEFMRLSGVFLDTTIIVDEEEEDVLVLQAPHASTSTFELLVAACWVFNLDAFVELLTNAPALKSVFYDTCEGVFVKASILKEKFGERQLAEPEKFSQLCGECGFYMRVEKVWNRIFNSDDTYEVIAYDA
jgi:hypothetical protein